MNQATVNDLANAASISPITVRHHLNALLAERLIIAKSVRQPVGRPYYSYTLSEAGHEQFPQKYLSLTTRLLVEFKDRFPPVVVNDLFESLVQKIVDEHRNKFASLSFEERLDYTVELLAEEGFLARWEQVGDAYQIIEFSCPFLGIGQQHAEICSLDTTLIEAVMGTTIEQHSCMLNGDNCCQFTIDQHQIPLNEVHIK